MEIFLDNEEIEEITIDDIIRKSEDRGIVRVPDKRGRKSEGENNSELTKEIIALDAIGLGSQIRAAEINGVTQASANQYSNGEHVSEDTKTNILAAKHNIADKAIAKLMESLDLFDPTSLDKPKDLIQSASMLAGIIEKVSSRDNKNGNQVNLILYGPRQNTLDKYPVIEV